VSSRSSTNPGTVNPQRGCVVVHIHQICCSGEPCWCDYTCLACGGDMVCDG
jgi:hypothetical protein